MTQPPGKTADKVVGATAMGGYAEEWTSEVSLAVRAEVPVTAHADVVHPFPTYPGLLALPDPASDAPLIIPTILLEPSGAV